MNATHTTYYHLCLRKLWLFDHGIRMEHTSDAVYEGKMIGETAYGERAEKNRELQLELPDGLGFIRLDYYDAAAKTVHETKKSDKMEAAHIAQLKFYLWVLEANGVTEPQGIIEYPKLRHKAHVSLSDDDRQEIPRWIKDIERICALEQCPPPEQKPICKNCAYYEYCFVDE